MGNVSWLRDRGDRKVQAVKRKTAVMSAMVRVRSRNETGLLSGGNNGKEYLVGELTGGTV